MQSSDIRKAIVSFQFVERIKSELIIANRLMEVVMDLKDDEQKGANRLLKMYLETLLGEINIAQNLVGGDDFLKANQKVTAAVDMTEKIDFEGAIHQVSEAISAVVSTGQWAMQTLKDNGVL